MDNSGSISYKAASATFVALLLIALFLLIWHFPQFFLLVFAGILFGVMISGIALFLSRKSGMRYGFALAIVLIFLAALITTGFMLLAPTVSEQAEELRTTLPRAIDRLKASLSGSKWGQELLDGVPDQPGKYLTEQSNIFARLGGIFSSTLGILANFVVILVTGIYFAASPGSYKAGFVKLFTPRYRHRIGQVLEKCFHTLTNWLVARSITMVIVGVATGIGLSLLDMPLPFVLAVIAALLNFVPNVGPIIAAIPALLLAFLQGTDQVLYVALLYLAVQSLEGYILTPLLDKKFVSIPPAMDLFGLVLLGLLAGIGGVFLASPLMAVLIVIVNELYVKDYLEGKILQRNTLQDRA